MAPDKLVERLRSPDSSERVLECLLEHGGAEYIEAAERMLRDSFSVTRVTAIECLQKWGASEFCFKLASLLSDPDRTVRAYAGAAWEGWAPRARSPCSTADSRSKQTAWLEREFSRVSPGWPLPSLRSLSSPGSFQDTRTSWFADSQPRD